MHLLFVCSHGRHRSVTAAALFSQHGHDTRSAGCHPGAARPVTLADLEWADHIYVFERNHRNRLRSQWPTVYQTKSIHCCYIPDEWDAHDPELITLITKRMPNMTESNTVSVPHPTPPHVPRTTFELSLTPLPLSPDDIYEIRDHLRTLLPGSTERLVLDLVDHLIHHQHALRDLLLQHTHIDRPQTAPPMQ